MVGTPEAPKIDNNGLPCRELVKRAAEVDDNDEDNSMA